MTPVRPIDVGCGTLQPVRSSSFAALYEYHYGEHCGRVRADDKVFELPVIVATTKGRWEFHGEAGRTSIDGSTLMLGDRGGSYGCRHDAAHADSNLAVCLRPEALDPGVRLFEKQIVPAKGALRMLQAAFHAQTDNTFDAAVLSLFESASRRSGRGSKSGPHNVRMQRIKRFIEMHACESLDLAGIAKEAGVSPFTLLRQFRAATGTTPHAYVLDVRLERARQLLRRGVSVERAARSSGFDDLAYFSRFFKARTGCTPSSFRRFA